MFLITGWSVSHVRILDLWYGITYNFDIIILFFTDDQFVSSGRSSQRLSFVDSRTDLMLIRGHLRKLTIEVSELMLPSFY